MDPDRVREVATAWTAQQDDLAAVAAALARADTSGFSERVAPAAAALVEEWRGLAAELAAAAEHEAAALRETAADWVRTDRAAAEALLGLSPYAGGQP